MIQEIVDLTEKWLITGELNSNMLSDVFQFNSPFWKNADKLNFMKHFGNSTSYQEVALSKITHFDPVIKLKSVDEKYFAIILQYHTQNGSYVYETVFGIVDDGLLIELRSIYDLDETKKALKIN